MHGYVLRLDENQILTTSEFNVNCASIIFSFVTNEMCCFSREIIETYRFSSQKTIKVLRFVQTWHRNRIEIENETTCFFLHTKMFAFFSSKHIATRENEKKGTFRKITRALSRLRLFRNTSCSEQRRRMKSATRRTNGGQNENVKTGWKTFGLKWFAVTLFFPLFVRESQ